MPRSRIKCKSCNLRNSSCSIKFSLFYFKLPKAKLVSQYGDRGLHSSFHAWPQIIRKKSSATDVIKPNYLYFSDVARVEIIMEENRQLRQKLAESRGALRDTADRLAASSRQFKKDQWLSNNTRPPRQQQQQLQHQQLMQPPPPVFTYLPPPPQQSAQQHQVQYYQDVVVAYNNNISNSNSPMKPSAKTQTPTHRPSSNQRNWK